MQIILLTPWSAWGLQVVQDMAVDVVQQLLQRQAARLGVPAETLFPAFPALMSLRQLR
jgi:hypothetical protein